MRGSLDMGFYFSVKIQLIVNVSNISPHISLNVD